MINIKQNGATWNVLYKSNAAIALLNHAKLQNVIITFGTPPRGAHGVSGGPDSITINDGLKGDTITLSVVIVHELTHCLDMHITEDIEGCRAGGKSWATEINAHYNQGLFIRELLASDIDGELREKLTLMSNSATTFGLSADWRTRKDVTSYLKTTSYIEFAKRNDTRYNEEDTKWVKTGGVHYFQINE